MLVWQWQPRTLRHARAQSLFALRGILDSMAQFFDSARTAAATHTEADHLVGNMRTVPESSPE